MSGLLFCLGPYEVVEVEKPSPCYYISEIKKDGEAVKVFLEHEKDKMCPQVITKQKLKLERDVRTIRIILNNTVWKEIHLREERKDER